MQPDDKPDWTTSELETVSVTDRTVLTMDVTVDTSGMPDRAKRRLHESATAFERAFTAVVESEKANQERQDGEAE